MPQTQVSAYDDIAVMYHVLWADWYLPGAMPALERLFFSQLAPGARVLDVCCGSGHVTKELVRRDYEVTGVDSSAELIAVARKELPGVDFRVQDVTALELGERFDAALSTFDSLNHILSLDGLHAAFAGVHEALKPGGLFAFDMNLEEAYSADLKRWSADVKPGGIGLVRGSYDSETHRAQTELIWLVQIDADQDLWQRRQSLVEQRCYAQSEILQKLSQAGFRQIEMTKAREAGMSSELGFGRIFVTAHA